MNDGVAILLSWQFILFAIVSSGIVLIIRSVLEYFFPKLSTQNWYRKIFLPIIPMMIGAILGYLAKSFPYPWTGQIFSGRIMFGFAAGLLSGVIYKMVTENIIQKADQIQNTINQNGQNNNQNTTMNDSNPPNPQ